MKKIVAGIAVLLCLATVFAGGNKDKAAAAGSASGVTEISLWTYPIGNWGDQKTVDALLADFHAANPGIKVTVDYLTYADGDDKVNTAIEGGAAPDLIMEGPERLVANWGAKGKMVDISDLFDATDKAEINAAALAACFTESGAAYEYPLVMTAHCMAINKTVFEKAGALQYIDQKTRTWTTDNFFKAVDALYKAGYKNVGAVYCVGQGGDQGTRALVNNLYGGTFTDAAHTKYTWDDPKNVQALEKLYATNGINFDAGIAGGDEIALFYNGTLQMAFCWNIAQQLNPNSANTGAAKTLNGDDIMFVAFPSQKGTDTKLQGGIWGFGIFDNGKADKIAAAKTFIKYMCDSAATADAVKAANYFAVRNTANGADLSKIWADNAIMNEYTVLMPYLGDYYQVTKGWAEARTQWWNMLQQVGAGKDVATVVKQYAANANAAAK
ncbi:MAG: extracellular solute-binding protein [Treponema sp.]|nr:extracellular solute-binding protein [Spirochaetia bacterium]MDY4674105.1 extracellular solute-binding protein [Treponema sp.]